MSTIHLVPPDSLSRRKRARMRINNKERDSNFILCTTAVGLERLHPGCTHGNAVLTRREAAEGQVPWGPRRVASKRISYSDQPSKPARSRRSRGSRAAPMAPVLVRNWIRIREDSENTVR